MLQIFLMKKFKLEIEKKLIPVYLIRLSDLLYRREVVKLIRNKFGNDAEIFYYSLEEVPLKEIFSNFRSQNLFDPKKIVVCYDGDKLSEKDKKFLLENIDRFKKVKNSILIIFFDDKTIKHKDFFQIQIPSEKELIKFIILYFKKNNIKVDENFAKFLIENTGMDYNKISLELKKILSFAEGKSEIAVEDIKDLVKNSSEQNIFKLFDYFFEKDFNNCIKTFYKLKELNTNINLLLAILQRNIIQIAKIKSLIEEDKLAEKDISKKMNLNSFVAKKLIRLYKKYSIENLKNIYFDLYEIEKNIKSVNINPATLFENFLLRYLR